jgi:DNA-binding NtrC family response regulator
VLGVLVEHAWPGNVRELNNVIEHALTLCRGEEIRIGHLPHTLKHLDHPKDTQGSTQQEQTGSIARTPYSDARKQMVDEFGKHYLEDLLKSTEGNLSEASRRSQIDRSNLRRMMKKHHLDTSLYRLPT